MKFTDKVYDILKWIAQLVLPAAGTLYFALSGIWGWPYGEEIVGTIAAIDTFLGVILKISDKGYDGDGTILYDDGEELYLDLVSDVDEISKKGFATFKVDLKKKVD